MKNKKSGNSVNDQPGPAIGSPEEANNKKYQPKTTKLDKLEPSIAMPNSPVPEKLPKIPPAKPERTNPSLSKKPENPAPPKLSALIYTKDADRDQLREAISKALCKVVDEVGDNPDIIAEVKACDPYRVAVQVETALYEKWGSAKGSNRMKYRSIKFNITDGNNPDFRRKVLLGIFPPHTIPELTPDDMASDARKKQNEKIKEKALFNSQRSGPSVASTNAFKCGKCGKRECNYYQLQTRSADEPMTTFVTCANCDNRWKF